MSSPDQLFDILAGYTHDIRSFTSHVADAADAQLETVATQIKGKLASADWLPQAARPPRPGRPPMYLASSSSSSYVGRVQDWIWRHRALTAALVAFVGTSGVLLWARHKQRSRKRRAQRASNGARREVVVIAGPAGSPMTRSLSLDLERRGFIVYVSVSSAQEAQQVLSEARVDIQPLHLDFGHPRGTEQAMENFSKLLLRPRVPFSEASPHKMHFSGLIVVPDVTYVTGPVQTLLPDVWSDALNARVVNSIATVQTLLPAVSDFRARVLVLTPSIVPALRPPLHGMESTVVGALDGFTGVLGRELSEFGVDVCHMKLGAFDCSSMGGGKRRAAAPQAETMLARCRGLVLAPDRATGSPLRELHVAVFDALTQKRPSRVWHVGRGSVAYDVVGSWLPVGVVGWMLGWRRAGGPMAAPAPTADDASGPRLDDSLQASGTWEKLEGAG